MGDLEAQWLADRGRMLAVEGQAFQEEVFEAAVLAMQLVNGWLSEMAPSQEDGGLLTAGPGTGGGSTGGRTDAAGARELEQLARATRRWHGVGRRAWPA